MTARFLLVTTVLVPLFPVGGTESTPLIPTPGGWEQLVVDGLLAPELVAAAIRSEQAVLVPSNGAMRLDYASGKVDGIALPAAQPAFPPRPVACHGAGASIGFITEPPGVVGVGDGCPFTIHRVPPHSSYFACAAAGLEPGYCFLVAQNIDFFAWGIYAFFCSPQGPVVFAHGNWQAGGSSLQSLHCTLFIFGNAAINWSYWVGACGGTAGVGAWSCTDLLK